MLIKFFFLNSNSYQIIWSINNGEFDLGEINISIDAKKLRLLTN